jgi:hypothetical protein
VHRLTAVDAVHRSVRHSRKTARCPTLRPKQTAVTRMLGRWRVVARAIRTRRRLTITFYLGGVHH